MFRSSLVFLHPDYIEPCPGESFDIFTHVLPEIVGSFSKALGMSGNVIMLLPAMT
jgi:hypothetical protein